MPFKIKLILNFLQCAAIPAAQTHAWCTYPPTLQFPKAFILMNSASKSKTHTHKKKTFKVKIPSFMVKIPSLVKDAPKEFGSPCCECINTFHNLASILFIHFFCYSGVSGYVLNQCFPVHTHCATAHFPSPSNCIIHVALIKDLHVRNCQEVLLRHIF